MANLTPIGGSLSTISRVLRTDELTRYICEEVSNDADSGRGDLASIARVGKAVGGVALDVLWNDISLKAVFHLFPSDAKGLSEEGLQVFVRPLTPADFARFKDHYAPRIRTLRRNEAIGHQADNHITIDFSNILQHLTANRLHQPPLFPNLRHIDWRDSLVHELPTLTSVFGQDITSFLTSIQPANAKALLFGHPLLRSFLDQNLAAPVQNLRVLSPPLTHLEVDFAILASTLPKLPPIVEEPYTALLQKCIHLVEVKVTLTPGLIHILGQLPALRSLSTTPCQWKSRDPPIDIESHPDASSPFPALKHLSIHTVLVEDVYSVLRRARCYPRLTLHVIFGLYPDATGVYKLLDSVVDPVISKDLTEFSLLVHEFAPFPPPEEYQLYRVTLNILRPLLKCRNLESFAFESHIPLDIEDSDLVTIASAWPKIASLWLGVERFRQDFLPRISVGGLASLSTCSNLCELGVTFTIPDTPPSPLPSRETPSASPLDLLNVGTTALPPNWTVAMAVYLARNFPALETVTGSFADAGDDRDRGIGWVEVEAGLQFIYEETVRGTQASPRPSE